MCFYYGFSTSASQKHRIREFQKNRKTSLFDFFLAFKMEPFLTDPPPKTPPRVLQDPPRSLQEPPGSILEPPGVVLGASGIDFGASGVDFGASGIDLGPSGA